MPIQRKTGRWIGTLIATSASHNCCFPNLMLFQFLLQPPLLFVLGCFFSLQPETYIFSPITKLYGECLGSLCCFLSFPQCRWSVCVCTALDWICYHHHGLYHQLWLVGLFQKQPCKPKLWPSRHSAAQMNLYALDREIPACLSNSYY